MPAQQCRATAKATGERCQRRAIAGGTTCTVHGSSTRAAKAAAARRVEAEKVAQAEERAVRLLGTPRAVDHREAATAELSARYAAVLWYRQEISGLDSLQVATERGESAHVLLGLLDRAERRLNEILRLCHDMRIDQQMQDLARAHADQTDRILHALIRGLGLDPQEPQVRGAVRAALTVVEGEAAS